MGTDTSDTAISVENGYSVFARVPDSLALSLRDVYSTLSEAIDAAKESAAGEPNNTFYVMRPCTKVRTVSTVVEEPLY